MLLAWLATNAVGLYAMHEYGRRQGIKQAADVVEDNLAAGPIVGSGITVAITEGNHTRHVHGAYVTRSDLPQVIRKLGPVQDAGARVTIKPELRKRP